MWIAVPSAADLTANGLKVSCYLLLYFCTVDVITPDTFILGAKICVFKVERLTVKG